MLNSAEHEKSFITLGPGGNPIYLKQVMYLFVIILKSNGILTDISINSVRLL